MYSVVLSIISDGEDFRKRAVIDLVEQFLLKEYPYGIG